MSARIFLSYSHSDSKEATQIAAALSNAGFYLWVDKQEIKPGDSFIEKMNEGLASASYVLALVSPNSIQSHWVSREWAATLASKESILLPVLLRTTELPPLLKDIIYFDLRLDFEAGVKNITTFFRKELKPSTPRLGIGSRPLEEQRGQYGDIISEAKPRKLKDCSRRVLRRIAIHCIKEADFSAYCFDLGINMGFLAGASLNERILSLLHHLDRDGGLQDFATFLQYEQPKCVENQLRQVNTNSSDPPIDGSDGGFNIRVIS